VLIIRRSNCIIQHLISSHSVGGRPVPIPVAARSKAKVCGRSPFGVVDSNPTGGMEVCLL